MANKIKIIFKGIYKWIPTLKDNTNIVTRDEDTQVHMTSKGGYLGFDESTGSYLRTPPNGLLPNMSGVNGNIGTSSWRFLAAYFKDLDIANGITSNSITSNNGMDCYGTFNGHGNCWLGTQYSTTQRLDFYSAYGGSRKGWVGHNGTATLSITNESNNYVRLATSTGWLDLYSTAFDSSFCFRTGMSTVWFAQTVSVPSLINRSKEEYKTNIVEYKNVIDIVRNSKIYEYNLKEELENDIYQKHYGFIINRETPKEIIVGDGIDVYSLSSIHWQATKELIETVEFLKKEVQELRQALLDLKEY